jgi:hypothetical protein
VVSGLSRGGVRSALVVQAAITALFSLLPAAGSGGHWVAIQLALAAAAGTVAWYVGTPGAATRPVGLGFEGVALAVGVVGVAHHHYIPGTIVGIRVLVGLLSTGSGLQAGARTAAGREQQTPTATQSPAFVPPSALVPPSAFVPPPAVEPVEKAVAVVPAAPASAVPAQRAAPAAGVPVAIDVVPGRSGRRGG